jgi:hypothetical protein
VVEVVVGCLVDVDVVTVVTVTVRLLSVHALTTMVRAPTPKRTRCTRVT